MNVLEVMRTGPVIPVIAVSYTHLVMRTILPFYGALFATLMLVTYVPAFSLTLPRILGVIHG